MILDDISTGASNDIERATKIANSMVTKYGMSQRVGTITLGSDQNEVFLGRDFAQEKTYSEETAGIIDEEMKRILDTCYNSAKEIFSPHDVFFFPVYEISHPISFAYVIVFLDERFLTAV